MFEKKRHFRHFIVHKGKRPIKNTQVGFSGQIVVILPDNPMKKLDLITYDVPRPLWRFHVKNKLGKSTFFFWNPAAFLWPPPPYC